MGFSYRSFAQATYYYESILTLSVSVWYLGISFPVIPDYISYSEWAGWKKRWVKGKLNCARGSEIVVVLIIISAVWSNCRCFWRSITRLHLNSISAEPFTKVKIDNDTVVSQFSMETTFNSSGRFSETILTKMISWLGLGFTIKYIIHTIYYNVHTNQSTWQWPRT